MLYFCYKYRIIRKLNFWINKKAHNFDNNHVSIRQSKRVLRINGFYALIVNSLYYCTTLQSVISKHRC